MLTQRIQFRGLNSQSRILKGATPQTGCYDNEQTKAPKVYRHSNICSTENKTSKSAASSMKVKGNELRTLII